MISHHCAGTVCNRYCTMTLSWRQVRHCMRPQQLEHRFHGYIMLYATQTMTSWSSILKMSITRGCAFYYSLDFRQSTFFKWPQLSTFLHMKELWMRGYMVLSHVGITRMLFPLSISSIFTSYLNVDPLHNVNNNNWSENVDIYYFEFSFIF